MARNGEIYKVYSASPANTFGLKVGDVVLEADGIKGPEFVDGLAATISHLKIKRGDIIFNIDIPRIPPEAITK